MGWIMNHPKPESMKTDRPTFELVIRSERPNPSADVRQLRELLKAMLRRYGWKCLRVVEEGRREPISQSDQRAEK